MQQKSSTPSILLVDDEPKQMCAVRDTLRECGYAIDGFTDPAAALESLNTVHYELMMVDLVMPTMSGIELMQAAHRHDPDIGCLILTGKASIASAVEALKLGAIDYVLKPFDMRILRPALQRAAHLRQVQIDKTISTLALKASRATLAALNAQLLAAHTQAEQANLAKSSFLAHISHEIRTPLNAIQGFAHILGSHAMPTTEEQRQKFATNILAASRHLLALADDVLDLSRVESGKVALAMSALALQPVVDECLALIVPLGTDRQIQLSAAIPEQMQVYADGTRLKQVLLNLLSNAVKYNRQGGTVAIACTETGHGMVDIAIRDTGHGIPAPQLSKLFQPFERLGLDPALYPGTGLGLVMVKRLTELMGGEVNVHSEAAIGSTFTISLTRA